MIKKVFSYLESLLFPPACPFCEKIMDYREDVVCGKCLQHLPFICEPRCVKCGKGLENEGNFCEDCKNGNHLYTQGRAVWKYEGVVADSIINYKYHSRKAYGEVYALWIVRCLGYWIKSKKIDMIIPVPIHEKRREKRGYNQTELIAEKVAVLLNIKYCDDMVIRDKNTTPQKALSVLERMKNMQRAFKVVKNGFEGKNVLIIDDIYTTGVTMDALSLVLINAGAANVYFAAVSEGG